jgi:hypothetical protein
VIFLESLLYSSAIFFATFLSVVTACSSYFLVNYPIFHWFTISSPLLFILSFPSLVRITVSIAVILFSSLHFLHYLLPPTSPLHLFHRVDKEHREVLAFKQVVDDSRTPLLLAEVRLLLPLLPPSSFYLKHPIHR